MKPMQKIKKMPDRDLLRLYKYLMKFKCNIVCDECLFSDNRGCCYALQVYDELREREVFVY